VKLRYFRPGRRAAWLLLVPLLLACDFVADRFAEPAETPEPASTVALMDRLEFSTNLMISSFSAGD
jgi:hypothetical protein